MLLRSLCCTLLLAGTGLAQAPATKFEYHYENILGTSLELHVLASSQAQADLAQKALLSGVEDGIAIVSTWTPDSEMSRALAQAGKAVPASSGLIHFLQECERWQELGKGAFQPRVAELTALWKAAEQTQTPPDDTAVQAALGHMGQRAWTLDANAGTVRFEPGAVLTFDAIAKGWIIDHAGQAVMTSQPEITGMMVNIGGDLRLWGSIEEEVAITHPDADAENAAPLAVTRLSQQAMATSGGYRRGWTIQGRRYSHLLDPRTGQPVTDIVSASAIAPDAASADALATLFSVLPAEESLALAASMPQVHCLLVNAAGQTFRSPGWSDFLSTPALAENTTETLAAVAEAAPEASAPASMEMRVDFDLANPSGGKYHRPYVAVWIEDEQEFPLRTLILWIQQGKGGLKYVRDLKRWDRTDKVRQAVDPVSLVQTISSATRKSGQYRVTWDGKDNQGVQVKPGNYTLCIEAAREKGTYQLIRRSFSWGTEAYLDILPTNVEISAAALEVKPKAAAP